MGAPHRGKKIMLSPNPTMPDSLGSFPAHIYAESSVLSHSTDLQALRVWLCHKAGT